MTEIFKLIETVEKLRDPENGCPWDIEQTHQSITDCLINECCELLETIDLMDMDHMKEELGDVLLQVIFHSQIAKEDGNFDFESVCAGINEKLIRRHPHVFGDGKKLKNSSEVLEKWEYIKSKEKNNKGKCSKLFKVIPRRLSSLMFASEVQKEIKKKKISSKEVSKSKFTNILDILFNDDLSANEMNRLVGEALYNLVYYANQNNIDSEKALRHYTQNKISSIENEYS